MASKSVNTILKWLMIFSSLLSTVSGAATVEPGIKLISDNETIYLGDSIIIDVEAVDLLEPLDVSSLFKHADLLRETTGTRIAVIEGRVVEVKLRRMEFIPKQEGRAFFGPLSADSIRGAATSNTLIIDVLPPVDTQWQPQQDDLTIDVSFTLGHAGGLQQLPKQESGFNLNAFVGQHIVADIILRHRHPIFEEQLVLPSFEGFDVLKEFEQRRTTNEVTASDGTKENFRITAWRYHLFPQRSGKHRIEGISWSGTTVKSRTQRSEFERKFQGYDLTIKAAADSAHWWLPATDVSLTDEWSKDPRELSAGDEIIRTITLSANNVLANHLPEVVPLESRAISSTLIDQQRHQEIKQGNLTSTATFTFRMVAQSPIPVFLDTVRVVWFDTKLNEQKEAIIPARRINVGLPDRADLLADLALEGSPWDRFTFWVQSNLNHWLPWDISLFLLSIGCVLLCLRECLARLKHIRNAKHGTPERFLPEL